MTRIEDVIGKKFGKLVVVAEERIKGTPRRVDCQCDCGTRKDRILLTHLRSGKILSCGCYRVERVREVNSKLKKSHGMYYTRQYSIWKGIMDRVGREGSSSYKDYGGRGITCDPKWRTFEGFWEDMQEGYSDNLEIDRIDVDGDYCMYNCRWVDRSMQVFNRRLLAENTSGRTGVGFYKSSGKWYAEIKCKGVRYFLGTFDKFEDAVTAREVAELNLFGEVKKQ